MVDAYRSEAGSLPQLNIAAFRGTAIGLANYVFGLVSDAMQATDDKDRRHADRSVQHMLAHLPSRTTSNDYSTRADLGGAIRLRAS